MMKKLLALLLMTLLVLPTAASALTVSDPGVFPIVGEDDQVTLTIMACVNSTCESWKDNLTMKQFEEETGVKVNWIEVMDADIQETIRRTLISGDMPDIVLWWFSDTAMIQSFGSAGSIIPLNDLIEDYTVNAKVQLETDPELKKLITSDDGNIYTLWRVHTTPSESVWNKQYVFMPWFEQYAAATGADMPETLEEYRAMLEYFRDNDMNGNGDPNDEIPLIGNAGAAIEGSSSMSFIMSAFQLWNCGDYYHITDEGELVFEANTQEYRDGLSYMNKMFEDGLYTEEDFTLSLNDMRAITSVASQEDVVCGVIAAPFYFRAITQAIYQDCYVDYQPIPPLKNYQDEDVRQVYQRWDALYYPQAFITSSCEYPEVAIKWLDYWLSEEGALRTSMYGKEGRDWEWTYDYPSLAGNTPSLRVLRQLEGAGNAEFPGRTGVPFYMSEELFMATTADPNSTSRNYHDYRVHQVYAPYCVKGNIPAIVWCSDEDILAEYSEYKTLIGEYVRAEYAKFIMGTTDIDNDADWQAYLDGLEALGLPRYLEVLNAYYGL